MITLTQNAVDKIKSIYDEENKKEAELRIGIKGGGCSGFSYVMDFDEKSSDVDQHFEVNGVKIVVDSKSLIYLAGTEVDYTDGFGGSGFVFNNPNATRSCGCGSSFAV
ncbi:MAG: iron-sulfur cluster insertion protein ErpA [Calditrichaceae bacterium]